MNRLNLEKRIAIIAHLVEGVSINSTARLTGVSPTTVIKLLEDVGAECSVYLHFNMVKLPCEIIQVDEIWSFIKMKERKVPPALKGQLGYGDTYTWVALDPKSKLVPCFLVGRRDTAHAKKFMNDLAWRLPNANRVQLTSDGHSPYLEAVEEAFGGGINYAMMVKHYGGERVLRDGTMKRCGSSECSSITKKVICGKPDPAHVSTSLVERQNRTIRMRMRRLTREVDAFSKKWWNHHAATALHFMHYNFACIHRTLRWQWRPDWQKVLGALRISSISFQRKRPKSVVPIKSGMKSSK